MRILYDFEIVQLQRYGGISRYYFELISRLVRCSEVEVALFLGIHQNQFDWESLRARCRSMVSVYCEKRVLGSRAMTAANLTGLWLYERFGLRADLLHLTYYPPVIVKRKGMRMVVTVHDMTPELYPEFCGNGRGMRRRRMAISAADLVICVSETTREDLVRLYGIDPGKTRVVYHGATFPSTGVARSCGSRMELPTAKPYILYVGVRDAYKNFRGAVDAYAEDAVLLETCDLVCFGAHPWTEDERRLFTEKGIGGKVHWVGGADEELWECYRNAAFLLYPSFYEGFGFPLLEAMAAGCPIVASNRGSIPEIGGGAVLLFDPMEGGDMAAKMRMLLESNALRGGLVERGYARLKDFSWERTAEETLDVYRSL